MQIQKIESTSIQSSGVTMNGSSFEVICIGPQITWSDVLMIESHYIMIPAIPFQMVVVHESILVLKTALREYGWRVERIMHTPFLQSSCLAFLSVLFLEDFFDTAQSCLMCDNMQFGYQETVIFGSFSIVLLLK